MYQTVETWLIIQHEDGRLEDKGFVKMRITMPEFTVGDGVKHPNPLDTRQTLSVKCEATGWKGAVKLEPEDHAEGGELVSPLKVVKESGTELWHIGRNAYAFVKRHAYLWPIERFETAV